LNSYKVCLRMKRNLWNKIKKHPKRCFFCCWNGRPNSNSGELFEELINHIKSNFSETYEFIEESYKAIYEIEKDL
jgi:hypothetical protein